jgi:eukaryotic-like serine/threonine-protein kinase
MSDHWQELQDLFNEVCSLDPTRRREVLDERAGGTVRREAERMLQAYDQEQAATAASRTTGAGMRFGVWETVRLLGRGGMGEVWLVRRADGQLEQQAALKILSPYLAAPDSVNRFRRERQLLARLEHPNIARLLDGGVSDHGEPYLAMEYVEGTRLDSYCEERHSSIPERLELMIKVCAAVNAAHQYLVVHRDLKPANILVTKDGEPKLLDFGIAKVLDAEGVLEQTVTANVFLTPMYASPEILRGQPVTVASDIYSLGVVLYELLCGQLPFAAVRHNPAALLEAVTTADPPRPSASAPAPLRAVLQGDLDSIVLKALARDPAERYASAAQFADDLRRYLDGQPVTAVPPSRVYLARKFVRRNRWAVSAAVLLLVVLLAGLAGTLWQARIARQERANAEQRFNDARKLANYLLFDLYDAVGKIPGTLPVQADMAGRTLEYLDRLAASRNSDPALRLELAEGYLKLGTVLGHSLGLGDTLGHTTKALESDRKGLAVIEPLVRQHPENLAARRTLAALQEQLGISLMVAGQYDDGLMRLQQAAGSFEQLAQAHPGDVRSLQDAGTAWQTLGKQLSEKGGYVSFDAGKPLEYLHKSIRELQAALQLEGGNASTIRALAATYEAMGRIESLPNPAQGSQDFTAGLALLARLPEAQRQTAEMRQQRARMLELIGWDKGQLGDYQGALADLDQAVLILDQLAAADPENAGAAYRRVDAYRSLGLVQGYAGQKAASLRSLSQAAGILDVLVKKDPVNKTYSTLRAELQGRVANLLVETGREDEAALYAQASIGFYRKLGDSPDATPAQLMEAVRALAETEVRELRDYPAALRYALRADQRAAGKNPAVLGYLAEAYGLNGNFAKALEAAQRGLAVTPSTKPGDPPSKLRQWLEDEAARYRAKAQ